MLVPLPLRSKFKDEIRRSVLDFLGFKYLLHGELHMYNNKTGKISDLVELISNKSISQNQKKINLGICNSRIGRKRTSKGTNLTLHHGPGTVLRACVHYLICIAILCSM